MAESLTLSVPSELDGERVDKALAAMLEISRAGARLLIDRGVEIDGSPAKPSDRTAAGSIIVTPEPDPHPSVQPEDVSFGVIYEDDALLVVDKPPGVVVHPGSGNVTGTLVSGLLFRYPDVEGVGAPGRWGLVHRLDRETSGAMIVARTQASFDSLTAQLARRDISRVYRALVQGIIGIPTGTIEAPIGRDPAYPTRRAVIAGGKEATTHYEVLEDFPASEMSLVEVRLDTGRTHQIRVHMATIGHPIMGDRIYGAKPSRVEAHRPFLHAHQLSFQHPETGVVVEVESPLPDDLQEVLDAVSRLEP